MLILAFDTSSKTVSVAIVRDTAVLREVVMNTGQNSSEVLLPAIENACLATGVKISDIDLFACTLGPGSFTGLRIGLSTLKGFLTATGKQAVGVSSLAALAFNVGPTDQTIGSVMDAGRGQVYLAYYQYKSIGGLTQMGAEMALAPQQIGELNRYGDVVYVGDGAVKYRDDILQHVGKSSRIADEDHQFIHASAVAMLAREKFLRHDVLDVNGCLPVYLRSADVWPKKQILP